MRPIAPPPRITRIAFDVAISMFHRPSTSVARSRARDRGRLVLVLVLVLVWFVTRAKASFTVRGVRGARVRIDRA